MPALEGAGAVRETRSLASRMRDRVRIERPVADDSFTGAGAGTWAPISDAVVAAEIEDMLPSRGERLAGGINVATRPARVRLRYRTDIKPSMRFVEVIAGDDGEDADGRIMQITAGPAKLGRNAVEFMVEDYSTAGNAA